MPRMDGVQAAEQINASDPQLPIVMLTVSTLDRNLFDAVQAGAVGYLSKGLTPDALLRALRDFHREEALPMSRVMAHKVLEYFRRREGATRWEETAPNTSSSKQESDALNGLSSRESEVLVLIAQGARDWEIAQHLTLTERTVKKHVQNIL